MTFNELGLAPQLLDAIAELGFETPTPVQEMAIPHLLTSQQDMVALAQTGTGKTATFGLPILHHLMAEPEAHNITRTLVLAPTRELCLQISKDLQNYAKYSSVRIVAVYGGEDIRKQLYLLDRTPDIIVATPGRLIDLINRGKILLDNVRFLVLDEADEMLNMGFKDDLDIILSSVPESRQTLLFSATMPQEIARIAQTYMHDAREIQIGERNAGTENVDHIYYVCRAENRYLVLKRIVDLNPDIYGIVFCRTKADCQEVSEKLIKDGYNADALHGDLTQVARDNVMQRFRLGAVQLLVATDVAARGLDVHDLTHVINYQLPDDPEVYTHRSGRTGRAGKRGISVNIVHLRETRRIKELERLLQREFRRQQIPSGLDVCRKQLFNQIARLQQVDTTMVDQLADDHGMAEVMRMLDYMPKEELIKRFVALEFNRFLEYYKDAPDLNVEERKDRSVERKGRDGGPKNGRMVRLKINVGMRDNINPKRFLALVNDTTHDRTIHIGDIEVQKNYTFFDVFLDQKQKIISAFRIYEDLTIQEAKGMQPKGGDGPDDSYRKKSGRGGGFAAKRERKSYSRDKYADGSPRDLKSDGRHQKREHNSASQEKPWRNKGRK